uniref:hypothetical protein n=1 Tax=Nocardia suismassiliense TaxID=2077092 RepID=UPI003F4992F0
MNSKKNAPRSRKAHLDAGHTCNGHHEAVSDKVIANDAIARNRPNGLDHRVDTTLEVNGGSWPFNGKAKARISMPVVGVGFVALFVVPGFTLHLSAGTISDGWRGTIVLTEIGAIFVMTLLISYWQWHKQSSPVHAHDGPNEHRQSGKRQGNDNSEHRQEER